MLEKLVVFVSYSYYGGQIGDFLNELAFAGFFSYVLPFLLIFPLVYIILIKTNLFKSHRGVAGIISLSVALMALQFGFVPEFFSEIFPRVGVALAIILTLILVAGLFIPDAKFMNWVFLLIGAVILVIILVQSAGNLGWPAAWWWYDNWPLVAGAVFFLIVIATIIGAGKEEQPSYKHSPFLRHLFGE